MSPSKFQLLGLNLLCLLSQNRVAEFHTELELLPAKEIQGNIYISHPVSLEQFLMEGSYNKVFLSKGNVPAASYSFFMDSLLDTVRDEIAGCIEKAYERISLPEVMRMLFLDSPALAQAYAAKVSDSPSSSGHFSSAMMRRHRCTQASLSVWQLKRRVGRVGYETHATVFSICSVSSLALSLT